MDEGSPGKSFAGGRNTPPPGLVPVDRKIRCLTATVTSSFDPRELVSWVKEIRRLSGLLLLSQPPDSPSDKLDGVLFDGANSL